MILYTMNIWFIVYMVQNSFFPDAIKIWNSLPQDLIDCSNIDSFRDNIYKHYS